MGSLGTLWANAKDDEEPEDKPEDPTACITHTIDARYISGFNHMVHLKSSCEVDAECDVSTDVNPKVQSVIVPAGGRKTVLTYRGSPSRVFKAKVECELRSSK